MVELVERYHVPRSQVWQGSRGRAAGRVHLYEGGAARPICGAPAPWYPREPLPGEQRCTRCAARAERDGLVWPSDE